MTTMGDKLRAEAEKLREQASALEVAAAFLDGQQRQGKQRTVSQQLAKAATVRAAQRNGSSAHAAHSAPQPVRGKHGMPLKGGVGWDERTALIHEVLANGPQRVGDIHAHLAAHGVSVTPSRVAQILTAMPGLRRVGRQRHLRRWALRASAEAARP